MQQYIKDLIEYPQLEEAVKAYARDIRYLRDYDQPYTQRMTVNSFMTNWYHNTIEGEDFWYAVSQGNFERAISIYPWLKHLFTKSPKELEIINNALCT